MNSVLSINLPFPISTNRLWTRAKKGLRSSDKYKAWKREASDMYLMQKRTVKPISGHFCGVVTVNQNKRKTHDIDNLGKCLFDFLQRMELIENDSLQDKVTIQWGHAPEGCLVELYQ